MGDEIVEREFLGRGRGKIWTYLIFMVALVVAVVVVNVVWTNPTAAKDGFRSFIGLPSAALAAILFVAGVIVFWGRFDVGGLVVLPYVIPIVVFLILLMVGIKRSV